MAVYSLRGITYLECMNNHSYFIDLSQPVKIRTVL
jgi:hypothetical protein